jgi:hypothetical protein
MGSGQCIYDTASNTRSAPADEAIVAGGVGAKGTWQIARQGAPERRTQKMPLRLSLSPSGHDPKLTQCLCATLVSLGQRS